MTIPRACDCLRKILRSLAYGAGAAIFLFPGTGVSAQGNVSFEASVAAKEIVVGIPFELTFALKNAEGSRFTPPSFSGFRAGGISEMRGMSFVNGKSSSSQSWSLELTPTKAGTFTIGAATVTANGRVLSTKPLTLRVLSMAASSRGTPTPPPNSDDRVFVVSELDRKEAYIGQQLSWKIRLYTQLSVEGYDIISLPGFEGFYAKEKIRYDKRVEYLSIRGKKYAVRTLHEEAVFPQESGDFTIGAARVSVGIEQPGAPGFLFGPKPVTLQTQPLELRVKPLPQPLPTSFTGGVGSYEWVVQADTNTLTTDDALTIVVEVKGNGDARRFAPPKIEVPASCEIFEPRILEEEEYESESEILHRKKFEYVVLPKDTGALEIWPMLICFDVDSNGYTTLAAAPIRVQVSPGKNYQSPSIAAPPLAEPPAPKAPGLWEKMAAWLQSPWLWAVLVLPFALLGIFFLLRKRERNPAVAPQVYPAEIRPPSQNLSEARRRFAQTSLLAKGDDPDRFFHELFRSLQHWLSARLHLQPVQMNDSDVGKALILHGATPIRAQALLTVWHTCEQAIYGGQAEAEQMEPTWRLAEQLVDALDKELK